MEIARLHLSPAPTGLVQVLPKAGMVQRAAPAEALFVVFFGKL